MAGLPEAILRRHPPERALRWAAARVGPRARVTAVRWLRGGTSTAVHALAVEDARRSHRLVLRRHVSAAWLDREPDLVAREADALAFLAGTGVPAPELVAIDADGRECDVPAVLMTRLPGRVDLGPRDPGPYLLRLAAALSAIHAVEPRGIPARRRYRPYNQGKPLTPPSWSRHPGVWERALEIYEMYEHPPAAPEHFIHRDYHPGNVLWRRGAVTGVVDWIEACVGPGGADIGHCRHNLAVVAGLDAAGRFLAAHRSITGPGDYHPFWDIASAVDVLPDLLDLTRAERVDAFVAAAVARARS